MGSRKGSRTHANSLTRFNDQKRSESNGPNKTQSMVVGSIKNHLQGYETQRVPGLSKTMS